eukprot:5537432-Pleurochrysis_carterae.AAC.3
MRRASSRHSETRGACSTLKMQSHEGAFNNVARVRDVLPDAFGAGVLLAGGADVAGGGGGGGVANGAV